MRRLGSWLLARLRPEPEVDQAALDLYLALRRERLRADVERLRHLLTVDSAMSATRQIANRLAYDWVRHELRQLPDPTPRPEPAATRWSATDWPVAAAQVARYQGQRAPEIEILEIGWRH